MRRSVNWIMALIVGVSGCGRSTDAELVTVTGTVSCDGVPVDEGYVSLYDEESGTGGEGTLTSGGRYYAEVPPGTYQIAITPPIVAVDIDPNIPPAAQYKPTTAIPERYRHGPTSGLSARVSRSQTDYDFQMTR